MSRHRITSISLRVTVGLCALLPRASGQPPPAPSSIAVIDLEKVFQQSKNYREWDKKQRDELHETEQAILNWNEKAENHRRLVVSLVPSYIGSDRIDKQWYLGRARQRFARQQYQLEQNVLGSLQPILREITEKHQIGVVLNTYSSTFNGPKTDQERQVPRLIIHHTPPLDITELVSQRLRAAENKERDP